MLLTFERNALVRGTRGTPELSTFYGLESVGVPKTNEKFD